MREIVINFQILNNRDINLFLFKIINNIGRVEIHYIKFIECALKKDDELNKDEFVSWLFEESTFRFRF